MRSRISSAAEWAVLLPLLRKLVQGPRHPSFLAGGTGLVWLAAIMVVAMGIGSCDGPPDGSPIPEPTQTPTPEQTAAPTPTPTPPPPEGFSMHFIDIGQGDAILIETDTAKTLLVDGGGNQSRIKDGLSLLGVTDLDAILVTHAHEDHYAGLVAVLEDYDIERIYWSGAPGSSTFNDFVTLSQDEGADISEIRRGDAIQLGALEIQVLHPAELTNDKNADSIVLLVQCGTVDVLLAGDADVSSEESMITAGVLTNIDVLKVGHHGSRTATSPAFLDVVRPEYAVISAGLNSQYGHPHQETLDALNAAGVEVFRTDTTDDADGVTLTTDCSDVTLETPQPPAAQPTQPPAPALSELRAPMPRR